ncbi:MAG: metal-dependent transcriptional regulator, partial [Bacteroidota bacterium]
MPSISKENYLKAVYQLCQNSANSVSTLALAQKLNITNAATSDMAKGLLKQGFVNYKKYKGVSLTSKGKEIAVGILRRHRLWELFLMQSLELGWEEVHNEAENLEHQTSDFLIDKIDDYLGNPQFDPHGEPIPQKNGSIPRMVDQIP